MLLVYGMTGPDTFTNRSLLAGLDLFQDVDPDGITGHLRRCRRRDVASGEVLLSPERANQHVYIVLSGRLRVHLDAVTDPPLTTLEPGACAGEMSIIENKDPSAYVVAAEDAHLMVIDHEALWQMVSASHEFARNLLVVLSQRLRSDNKLILDNAGILREFERNAITDALTELHNRHWLEDMFRRNIKRCHADGEALCLIMLDVDHFKRYNDRNGHVAGDNALCRVAGALRAHFRPGDLIARFGGDEFAVLLPDTRLADAEPTAERVREAVRNTDTEDDAPLVTVSMGVAEMAPDDTLEALLNRADSALYRAKLKGRNCVSD